MVKNTRNPMTEDISLAATTTTAKKKQSFWKRVLIIDDDPDITMTFKGAIENSNDHDDRSRRIEVYTYNDPLVALLDFEPNFYEI